MRMFLRLFIWVFLALWVGGLLFFPVVANAAFSLLADKQQAGLVVRNCLLALHTEGIVAGVLLLVLLGAAAATRAFGRSTLGPICCTAVMLGLTVFSQFHVIPQMERDRLAVGGDIDKAAQNDPRRMDFDRLHAASVGLEEGVLAAGVLMIVFLSRAPRFKPTEPTYRERG